MMEETENIGVDVDFSGMTEEYEIENFLESLGLERDVKSYQSLAYKKFYKVNIFDMSFQLNYADTYSEEWIEGRDIDFFHDGHPYVDWNLYFHEDIYCHSLQINDKWIATQIKDFDSEEVESPYIETGEEYWTQKYIERDAEIKSLSPEIKALNVQGNINLDNISHLLSLTCLQIKYFNPPFSLNNEREGYMSSFNIKPISRFSFLTDLALDINSLVDISALSGLSSLTTLNLSGCKFLSDIRPLRDLTSLISLDLNGCESLSDISALSGLSSLTWLNLGLCTTLTEISAIRGLISLTSLILDRCRSLTDITALSDLTSLTSLNLSECRSLTNITALSGLTSLTSLDLSWCESLTDITALSGLTSLTSLDLSWCKSLTDITLSGLNSLTSLDLSSNSTLTVMSLSGSEYLSELKLSGCERLKSLSNITNATRLRKLDVSDLKRLHPTETLEHLRSFTALEELDSPFHPSMVAELLAHTAVCRRDLNKISQSAREWLQESISFIDRGLAEQEQFAATLGAAFSLLEDHEVIPDYEAFLDQRTDFSATPWKAWLGGLKKNQGHAALVRSVERVDLASRSAGAIGGICAALPSSDASTEEQEWARDWLARMETAQASNAKNLLSVCAEICLAHARLGLQEALQRWLGRFTDASDPEVIDPIHEALGHWQLQQGDTTAASEHAWSIGSSQARDPLLGKLVESCYESDPTLACKALLHIDSLTLRADLASHLVAQETFAAEARNMQCLIVACDNSIEAMTQLITQAHPKADPTHLRALSEKLRAPKEVSSR